LFGGLRKACAHPTQLQTAEIRILAVKRVPDGFHRVTAHLTVRGANEMMAFYEKARMVRISELWDAGSAHVWNDRYAA